MLTIAASGIYHVPAGSDPTAMVLVLILAVAFLWTIAIVALLMLVRANRKAER